MTEQIAYNTRIYTDIQGLSQLKYDKNHSAVKKEVAQQFEAILMQMVLHSMRDASKIFSSDLFGSNQMEMYQEMFDKQLSLMMSNSNLGLASIIEKNIDRLAPEQLETEKEGPTAMQQPSLVNNIITPHMKTPDYSVDAKEHQQQEKTDSVEKTNFSSPEDFIKKLWTSAKTAAKLIGTSPEILLAQAALETNWGKSILQDKGISSHNLFNIKADAGWKDKITQKLTLEQRNGILVKEKAEFKNYRSYLDSFMDYTKLLKNNLRYQEALDKGHDPIKFVHALQSAGYATDENYAQKIVKVFTSQPFKNMIEKVKKT